MQLPWAWPSRPRDITPDPPVCDDALMLSSLARNQLSADFPRYRGKLANCVPEES